MCNAWKTCVRESLHAWYLKIVRFRRFIPLTWIIFRADNDEHGLNVLFQWEHCQIQDSGSLHKFTCKLLESQIWQFSHWNRELRLCSSFSARKIIQDRGMDLLNVCYYIELTLRYQKKITPVRCPIWGHVFGSKKSKKSDTQSRFPSKYEFKKSSFCSNVPNL